MHSTCAYYSWAKRLLASFFLTWHQHQCGWSVYESPRAFVMPLCIGICKRLFSVQIWIFHSSPSKNDFWNLIPTPFPRGWRLVNITCPQICTFHTTLREIYLCILPPSSLWVGTWEKDDFSVLICAFHSISSIRNFCNMVSSPFPRGWKAGKDDLYADLDISLNFLQTIFVTWPSPHGDRRYVHNFSVQIWMFHVFLTKIIL